MKKTLSLILLMMLSTWLVAQDVTVSGHVTSQIDGEPIPGVSIVVVGTTTGVTTNADGYYTISTQMGETLRFSFIGMSDVEVEVTSNEHNVVMMDDWTDLEEVVVVGYGVQRKALVTGANVNVRGDNITQQRTSSAMEAIQGIAPGVEITRNHGGPGAGTKVNIRGMGTIGNANPLYVVDGVAVGSINYLNPADIESIDVLKDAASSAIYGARAANGVILVTTKRGEKGMKPRITYETYAGVQNLYKKPAALNAQEYMYIMDEARLMDGLTPFDWEDRILNQNHYVNQTFAGNLGDEYGQYVWDKLQSGWEGTDWVDEMVQPNSPMMSHSLNITGGSEDIAYSTGLSYFDQSGLLGGHITDAGYKRLTARLNTEMVLFKNSEHNIITIGENLNFTNSETRSVSTGNIYWNDLHDAIVTNPLMPLRWEHPDLYNYTMGYSPALEGVLDRQINPIGRMYYRNNYNWGKGNTIVGNAYALIEPIKDLKFRSSYGINSWVGHGRAWEPYYRLGSQYYKSIENDGAEQSMNQGITQTLTNTINYNHVFGDHRISVLLGNEIERTTLAYEMEGSINNTFLKLPEYAYLTPNINVTAPTDVSQISLEGRDWAAEGGGILSYMSRVSYNFREKYMLDATFRADASSNFAKGNRWGYFPSFAAAWILTEEDFMLDQDWITFGKLRASWGQNGNHRIGQSYAHTSTIAGFPGYFFGPERVVPSVGNAPTRVPNPNLKWETSEQLNIGLDARFLDSRLGLNFDWYNKITKDWLVQAPILGTFGREAPWINGGEVENKGVELIVSWNDDIQDFRYGITLSGAHNKNTVTKLNNEEGIILGTPDALAQGTSYISRVEVGYPIGFFYGYETNGILQNQSDIDNYVTADGTPIVIGGEENTPRRPGDVWFVDQNGDGVIDDDDKVMLGSPHPDFVLGFQLNAEFKGIYINTTLVGKFGMQVMRSYRSFSDRTLDNYTTEIFQRWHGEGTSNKLPRLSTTSNANVNNISDIYLYDADYLRISNLTIGYHFDHLLKGVSQVQGASVYASINNLYTFTKYPGMDPEVGYGHEDAWASGIDLGLYPLPRTIMFGVNFTF